MKKILLLLLHVLPSLLWAQQRYNLDMEKMDAHTGLPVAWTDIDVRKERGDVASIDSTTVYSGRYSLLLKRDSSDAKTAIALSYGVPTEYKGKKVKLRGYVRTENITDGWAGLWLRLDGTSEFDNMYRRGIKGTTPWTLYEIELKLDKAAAQITLGGLLTGNGKMWMDSLALWIDGKDVQLIPLEEVTAKTDELKWLKDHAMPLKTVDAGHGSEDLQGLKPLIGDAGIVALGECTHGTSEVFRMKHRLLEFLVTEMGFRVFAIEANLPEAKHMNEYVLYGKGTAEAALEAMYFWTWNTREVLEMVKWMRAYNIAHPDKMVQFTGFDMQFHRGACDNLRQFADRYDTTLKPLVDTVVFYCEKFKGRYSYTAPLNREERASVQVPLDLIAQAFEKKRAHYQQLMGDSTLAWYTRNVTVLQQYLIAVSTHRGNIEHRDKSMAENVKWLTEQNPGQKLVLWAHSGHVKRSGRSMGGHLDKTFKKDMVVIAFGAAKGQYVAVKRGEGVRGDNLLVPPVPHAFESYAQASGIGDFILDVRREQLRDDRASWLLDKVRLRCIGSLALDGNAQFEYGVLPDQYDAVIYLENTTPSKLLPGKQ
ncbi:erythromycin esterase family protein [Chitinophaga qingshengii]|uniref:Erythromycin esterase family protein n=1 Tax=Chitinophaga qingshengii TaxID=1569794 RepID=A0ABR7TLF5_9BACT|nr:erythromycin esterase family protein [Chitinophaga qingshengii]MBC9929889.1 erythromycin esterase family protein [Chitinophaga qingshengii]